jgi:hypothetical protein
MQSILDRAVVFGTALAAGMVGGSLTAGAVALTATDIFLAIDLSSVNDVGFLTGEHLFIGADKVGPSSLFAGTTGTATSADGSYTDRRLSNVTIRGAGPSPTISWIGNEGAISRAEFNFSVLPAGAPPGPIFIPTADSSGIFHFSISGIEPDVTYDLDPSVATGYIYSTGSGDPNFASVQLPDIGNPAPYSLYLWDGSKFVFDALLAPETLFDFGPAGVDRFEILGIDPSLGVDPSNPLAFITTLTFAAAGDFTGTMTPIVADVAEPGSIALLGIGLAAFGRLRRPRLGAVPGLRRGELVGQGHGGELSGLAGEQAREPRCGGRTAGGPFTRGLDPRVGSQMGAVAPQHQ